MQPIRQIETFDELERLRATSWELYDGEDENLPRDHVRDRREDGGAQDVPSSDGPTVLFVRPGDPRWHEVVPVQHLKDAPDPAARRRRWK